MLILMWVLYIFSTAHELCDMATKIHNSRSCLQWVLHPYYLFIEWPTMV